LERVFHEAARVVAGESSRIHYAYSNLSTGFPKHLLDHAGSVTSVTYSAERSELEKFSAWVRDHQITHTLAFDLPVSVPIAKALRASGVRRIVSYWGASISGIYPWYLRPLRRLQYQLSAHRPDLFVFESEGMRERAVLGAGIPVARTSVCKIGVDCSRFHPVAGAAYAHRVFGIPVDRRIVFFSGHMEERKGVHILIDAFARIPSDLRSGMHLLLAGNTYEDEQRLLSRVVDPTTASQITFAGYRNDIPELQQSATLGVIASTGWDSFTVSAVEMAATGLPLVVSDLAGLKEAVVPEVTGERVTPGDADALAKAIVSIVFDDAKRIRYGTAARARALKEFSADRQIRELVDHLRGR
jgi:glycosyltransferase involved in cell wall biosynthesis